MADGVSRFILSGLTILGLSGLAAAVRTAGAGGTPENPAVPAEYAHRYLVRVTGSDYVSFEGSCLVAFNGGTSSRDLHGVVPREIYLDADFLSCTAQKQGGREGRLTIQIINYGRTVAESETVKTYGVVSASGK